MKLLIVEDEPELLETMANSLRKESYVVETASGFEEAREKINLYAYDCLLLDITLPDGNGLRLLKELKEQNKAEGVIIVSAKDSLDDRVAGLNLGADDYLPKPFHLAELHARVKSVVRRRKFNGSELLPLGNLMLDVNNRTVLAGNAPLNLNRKELDVLLYLAANQNRLVSKTALAEHVWGDYIDQADSYEFIYSQIKNLRRKLKEQRAGIEIQAVYGIGYKLVTE